MRFDEDAWIGDALTAYLLRGAGEGVAIDGFVAASRDDRWLVLVRAHQLVLFDEVHGTEQVLAGADARGAGSGGGMDPAERDHGLESEDPAGRQRGEPCGQAASIPRRAPRCLGVAGQARAIAAMCTGPRSANPSD